MHPAHADFCRSVKKLFPNYFENSRVLDVGSLDVNGTNIFLFEKSCKFIGLDVISGPRVNVVSIAHEYNVPDESFDVVISTNSLEHDIYYPKTIKKMIKLVKQNGLIIITCPSYLIKEHGTSNNSPHESGTSQMDEIWANYYKPIGVSDFKEVVPMPELIFSNFFMGEQMFDKPMFSHDFVFWGIKKIV